MTISEFIVWAIIIALIILPSKYDPAIQLKEFNERWAKRIEERRKGR